MRRNKFIVACAVVVFAAGGGALVASADTPDPCDSQESDRAYVACRLDRIEKRLDELGVPSPSPSATPSPTATPEPTPTPTPTPSPTPTVPSVGFPNADNTGVPDGTTLTAYTGPLTITKAGTVIDSKSITGTLIIAAKDVKITRSKLVGTIDSDKANVSVTVEDSIIDGGKSQAPAVGYGDITMRRTEVVGSRVSVLCGSDCVIEDSWLHGQYLKPGSDWHVNGYVSNGGSNVIIRHNTIACEPKDNSNGGGCTGPAASFGDFGPLKNITYDNNLFKAGPGGYCLSAGHNESKPYGKDPSNVRVINNVFERGPGGKCGFWGPATSFLAGNGNEWAGNKYDDGAPVNP